MLDNGSSKEFLISGIILRGRSEIFFLSIKHILNQVDGTFRNIDLMIKRKATGDMESFANKNGLSKRAMTDV